MEKYGERLAVVETNTKNIEKKLDNLTDKIDKGIIKAMSTISDDLKITKGTVEAVRTVVKDHDKKLYGNGETGVIDEVKELKRTTFQIKDVWKVIPVVFGLGMLGMILTLLLFGVISPEIAKEWLNR